MRVIVNCTVNIAYPQISSRQLPHFEVPPDASFAFLSIAAGTAPPSCGGSLAWSSRSPRLKQKNPRVREAFCSVCFGVRSCCDMLLYVARKSSILSRMVLAATRSIQFFELSIAMKHHEIFNTPTFVINCKDLQCFPTFQTQVRFCASNVHGYTQLTEPESGSSRQNWVLKRKRRKCISTLLWCIISSFDSFVGTPGTRMISG